MTDEFQPIRPRTVPLSHVDAGRDSAAQQLRSRWTVPLVLSIAVLLLVGVFVVAPRVVDLPAAQPVAAPAAPSDPAQSTPPSAAAQATSGAVTNAPSFRQQQRDQTRTAAQAALSRFVELQLEAEAALGKGSWGAESYAAAKERAIGGDEALGRDDFAAALAHYDAAADDLERLLVERLRSLEQALEDGAAALVARDAEAARTAFALAATIEPQDPRVTEGLARAERLPQVNELLRTARNQELAGDWTAALATLHQVEGIDPQISGLADALQRAQAGVAKERLQNVISEAFAHLDAGRHEAAQAAFRQALQLDPGNAAARGGVEQVEREAELARLERLERDAGHALADERWGDAEILFTEALALDPNIQFALAGRTYANERKRATEQLSAILADPDRLSSQQVYDEAQRTLAAAEALDPKGPGLTARIAEVRGVLQSYAEPVAVVLRSDNRTRVTVSTVGSLGVFTEKQLALRPGAYTVVGSRDGCRDVRERIVVRPEMAPVEIRCLETL